MFNKKCKKYIGGLLVYAVLQLTFFPYLAMAGNITTVSDVMTREKTSTASNHTIQFIVPLGSSGGEEISLTFPAGFTMNSIDYLDVDVAVSAAGSCATFSDLTLAGIAAGATWGVALSGQVLTLTSASGTISAGRCVQFEIGTNATTGGTGDTQITNPASVNTYAIAIATTEGDSGNVTVAIIDDDQVNVTASVGQSIVFDLDTSVADGETATPYSVALGTLATSDVETSGTTDSINMIIVEGSTNGTGGMVVTVRNANGSNGLVSTSVPADNIGSADATMAAGTENYGLCVITAGLVDFSIATPYSGNTCATNSNTNVVEGLTTTGESILSTTAPFASGHAEISVNGAVSGVTTAHSDYTDTLTFVATSTF
ncbi:MAG: hypothetical protein AAB438_04270 [Patescibacteria group bacterium]